MEHTAGSLSATPSPPAVTRTSLDDRAGPGLRTSAGTIGSSERLQDATDYLEVLDCEGCLITASEDGPALFGTQDGTFVLGRPWIDIWTRPEDRASVVAMLLGDAGHPATLPKRTFVLTRRAIEAHAL